MTVYSRPERPEPVLKGNPRRYHLFTNTPSYKMGNDKSFDVLPPLEREKYLPYHGQYETDKEDTTSSNILQWWSTGVETGIPTKAEKSLLESLAAWEEAKTVAKEAHKVSRSFQERVSRA
ncbi:hypothetical protein Tdes44962_MAKER06233 [Teratosphaeria destructans]|uniref:Uncharacterized protein n=1 Tax=Teratosphaeria destructans TaxID=418781 RepID=A0A9W7VY34_9PEZI|nr:hypothetical protein Tdes44962_MAKER06233 [Teratosphaeria destructans]